MPPSGYHPSQTCAIRSFCALCLADLVSENTGIRSAERALERELEHIAQDLRTNERSLIATNVLCLTRSFYEMLLSTHPKSFEMLELAAEKALDQIERDILSIHVSELS